MHRRRFMQNQPSVLIGNTFPLSLIRRPVRMAPVDIPDLQQAAKGRTLVSFRGHANTVRLAEAVTGLSLKPDCERPVLCLDDAGCPVSAGISFRECWLVTPDSMTGFRPAVGVEVAAAQIAGWNILKLSWEKQ